MELKDLDILKLVNRVAKKGYGKVGARKLLNEIFALGSEVNENKVRVMAYYGFLTKTEANRLISKLVK